MSECVRKFIDCVSKFAKNVIKGTSRDSEGELASKKKGCHSSGNQENLVDKETSHAAKKRVYDCATVASVFSSG